MAPSNGTLRWHPAMPPRPLHPAMAPRPPPKLVATIPSPHHSTLQWHPAMAPNNGTTSIPPKLKLVVTLPPNHSTLEWHPAMAPRPLRQSWSSPSPPRTIAHYNGTLQWHHVNSPKVKVGRQPPPTIAHYNGTLRWHRAMVPYDGTQQWHHVHCTLQWHPGATSNPPKWFVALPPIGSKNPYSYCYLGKIALLISGAEICSAEKALICKALWLHFGNHPTAAILTSQFVRVHLTMWTANNTYTVFMYRIRYSRHAFPALHRPFLSLHIVIQDSKPQPSFASLSGLSLKSQNLACGCTALRVHDLPSQSPSEFQCGLWKTKPLTCNKSLASVP